MTTRVLHTVQAKAIKMPQGVAAEYAKYSCNFYVGCSNSCAYCFNKRWGWGNVPKLKKCFKDENHALEVFEKDLQANLPELQKHGLLFSFTTDPMLPETYESTLKALKICVSNDVKTKVLTKCAGWIEFFIDKKYLINAWKDYVSFGYTLTGRDDLEPGASTNAERIKAMRKLHEAGFKTWASIEPIIDFEDSAEMIRKSNAFCDLYKIGLKSGKKYSKYLCDKFIRYCYGKLEKSKIYFKDSLLQQADISRDVLPENCVGRDYGSEAKV